MAVMTLSSWDLLGGELGEKGINKKKNKGEEG